jgi:hypothetical protein
MLSVPHYVAARSRQVALVHELNAIKEHWRTLKNDEARQAYAMERRAYKAAVSQVRIVRFGSLSISESAYTACGGVFFVV